MMGYIKDQAPDTSGKWDVAAIPGGGGNWGGSFLAIPKESKNPQAAYDLAAYLTAPEQELRIFKDTGNLPSLPALYTDPALTGVHEPVLLRRPRRHDLLRHRGRPAAAVPRHEERPGPPGRRERRARGRERLALGRRRLGEGLEGRRESGWVIGRGTDRAPGAQPTESLLLRRSLPAP